MSTKQRMISAADMVHLDGVPHEARATALWLWLHLDPMGRGEFDPSWIAQMMLPHESLQDPAAAEMTVLEHVVMLMDVGFLTTYRAEGSEWLLLLHPLKVDLRKTRILTPEPPGDRPWPSMAVGGAGARERGRERAREQVRAERSARADAWAAVAEDRAEPEEMPERPWMLDAPPMFCPDHMPHGAGRKKCGPCRDSRLVREEWMTEKVYEERLAAYHEQGVGYDGEPF